MTSTRILVAALLIALVFLVLAVISHRRALRRDAEPIGDHAFADDEYLEAMARRAMRVPREDDLGVFAASPPGPVRKPHDA